MALTSGIRAKGSLLKANETKMTIVEPPFSQVTKDLNNEAKECQKALKRLPYNSNY